MSVAEQQDLETYCTEIAQQATQASTDLVTVGSDAKEAWLRESARQIRANESSIVAANEHDLDAATPYGLTSAQVDRLRLTPQRIEDIAVGLEQVADYPDPIGRVIETTERPNGLTIEKVRVPLGVVFFVYESRPNVTADAAAICVKSGNAIILRGGKEAKYSSRAIVDLLHVAARETEIPVDAVQLVGTTDREAVGHFLRLPEYIQVAIPRGGEGLIRRVVADAQMPVIKHFTGNCHVYVDRDADLGMADRIVVNSKCQRMGVCNAAESLLVHADIAAEFVPTVAASLAAQGVEIRGDERICELVEAATAVNEDDYAAEYLGPTISARVVPSLGEAIEHINRYGSAHTDAIVTQNEAAAETFLQRVDSSAVMVNASTRFNDGGEFGLGAEIGISTDKIHARGPCGVNELTSYKYVVRGTGQLRE